MSAVSSTFLSTLLHALVEERHFALVEDLRFPTWENWQQIRYNLAAVIQFCWRPVMTSCRALFFVAPLVLLIVIAGCGGGSGGFDPNKVTVTVSPAAPTVPANGQVTLHATVGGCVNPSCIPSVQWSIAELQGSGAQCNWQGTTPPMPVGGPCLDGTIQGTDTPPALTVTYLAPSTSGTFHVVAEWDLISNPPIIKTGTAVITVP
jgi:hypothetical protein